MDSLHSALADAINLRRREVGLSQRQLCDLAGISEKHLSQMFTGHADGSLDMWDRLARVMGCQWVLTTALVSERTEEVDG